MNRTSMISGIAAIAIALTAGGAFAAKVKSSSYQNGDCKSAAEFAYAPSAAAAQAMWTATVSAKFGNKWANWVGAKNKSITPAGGSQYVATGKPCFYQPVM